MGQFGTSIATRWDTERMKQVKVLEELIRIFPGVAPANPIYGTVEPTRTDTIHMLKIKQNEVLSSVP